MSENGITIELSKAQVNRVLRDARKDDGQLGRAGVVAGLEFRVSSALLDDPQLSRSLLLGLMILACYPADGAPRSMTDVAGELEMWPGTIHRYVITLVKAGLLERDPVSREYRLAGRA
jgi:DNA-binding MarR family transcriptional regulator